MIVTTNQRMSIRKPIEIHNEVNEINKIIKGTNKEVKDANEKKKNFLRK